MGNDHASHAGRVGSGSELPLRSGETTNAGIAQIGRFGRGIDGVYSVPLSDIREDPVFAPFLMLHILRRRSSRWYCGLLTARISIEMFSSTLGVEKIVSLSSHTTFLLPKVDILICWPLVPGLRLQDPVWMQRCNDGS